MEDLLNCIASFARFAKIGLEDAYMRRSLSMFTFTSSVSFSSVDMKLIFLSKYSLGERLVIELFNSLSESVLQATQPHLYSLGGIEVAFRYFQNGKSSGKMVDEVEADEALSVSLCSLG